MVNWHLIRTKAGKERSVRDRLAPELPELLLPLLRIRAHRRRKLVDSVVPLFPCYLFAAFEADLQFRLVRYTPGIREVLCSGDELLDVPGQVIESLKRRCIDGPVSIPPPAFKSGDHIRVVEGPFDGLNAVFDSYVPGAVRVRILLSSLSGPRLVLPATSVVAQAGYP